MSVPVAAVAALTHFLRLLRGASLAKRLLRPRCVLKHFLRGQKGQAPCGNAIGKGKLSALALGAGAVIDRGSKKCRSMTRIFWLALFRPILFYLQPRRFPSTQISEKLRLQSLSNAGFPDCAHLVNGISCRIRRVFLRASVGQCPPTSRCHK